MRDNVNTLQEINPDHIKPNPENPRLIFHEDEMNELLESIREVGIKVPLTVYSDDGHFTLLDGERRWRCSRRLNLTQVPAIVQPKPSPLENLLMMFNIHNVRVNWDIMPMALKLRQVQRMLEDDGRPGTPRNLAAITGVPLTTVRRALELLNLPPQYQTLLLSEAEKPRGQQRIKADLFIEAYKSLHVIERYVPEVFDKVNQEEYIDSMVDKYVRHVIDNVVHFREMSKIARAERAGGSKETASQTVIRLVKDKDYSIEQAYHDTVQSAYEQRDLFTKLRGTTDKLSEYSGGGSLSDEMRGALELLRDEIDRLLRQ